MLTRRTLLQMNAALLALPVTSNIAVGSGAPRLRSNVFIDDQNADCVTFADLAATAGADVSTVGEEITATRYEALRSALANGSDMIIGLMPEPTAFLFEVMAHDVGRQLASFGEHYYVNGKVHEHRFAAPGHLAATLLPGKSGHWTSELLERFSQFEPALISSAIADARAPAAPAPQHESRLVSWVIAPLPTA